MQFPDNRELSSFLADFGATADDAAALLRVRSFDRLDPRAYLLFLEEFSAKHPPTREVPPYHEPFRL